MRPSSITNLLTLTILQQTLAPDIQGAGIERGSFHHRQADACFPESFNSPLALGCILKGGYDV
jgi:hypothetical protein